MPHGREYNVKHGVATWNHCFILYKHQSVYKFCLYSIEHQETPPGQRQPSSVQAQLPLGMKPLYI